MCVCVFQDLRCVQDCVCCVCCVQDFWWVSSRCSVGVFKMFGGCLQDVRWVSSRCSVGVFKIFGGCLQDFWWVSSRFGASPPDRQIFALFFLSPAGNFILSFSLWEVFSLNFGGVFEGRGAQIYTFGLSGCSVKPRRLRGRRGFTQQPENSKRAHLSAPALQKHHQNSTRRQPREREERMKLPAEERKKSAKFWALHPFLGIF